MQALEWAGAPVAMAGPVMQHSGDLAGFAGSALELDMQELESMEAPGWWTGIGISAGIVVGASAAYGGWALSVFLVT